MRFMCKILVPAVIFIVTLWILLVAWTNFGSGREEGYSSLKHEWTEIVPGNSKKYPQLIELFDYPGSVSHHIIRNNFGIVSDAKYQINSFGIRDTLDIDKPKKSHLLFAGCSFTFGDNIPYEDTYPFMLRNAAPEVNVRNLGFPGGGLHTALRYMEIVDIREFVPEPEGVFVYVSINDHFPRWIRNVGFLRWARETAPTYDLVNGKVTYSGKLESHPEYKRYMTLKSLGISLPDAGPLFVPLKANKEKADFFIQGVVLLKERYLKLFPKGRFIWIVHPMSNINPRIQEYTRSAATKYDLEVIFGQVDYRDYQKSQNMEKDTHTLQWDGHPNGEFNRWFSSWLKKKVL